MRLEDLVRDTTVRGVRANEPVTVVAATMASDNALPQVSRKAAGAVDERVVYRTDERGGDSFAGVTATREPDLRTLFAHVRWES